MKFSSAGSFSVFIAACALFTAVYDGLKRRDVSPTSILNAATVNHTGKNTFGVNGTKKNGAETTTVSFDDGTYMMIFWGQCGSPEVTWTWGYGSAAVCLAFYKGDGMTVNIGVGGGISVGGANGGGKTIVKTNFAVPDGYEPGLRDAIASGGGAGGMGGPPNNQGTFAGKESSNYAGCVWQAYGYDPAVNLYWAAGLPATQSHGGYRYDNVISPNGAGDCGGAGYYDGGAGGYYNGGTSGVGGGGSCTPWCYPLFSSDIEEGPRLPSGNKYAGKRWCFSDGREQYGSTYFYRIDPTVMPTGATVNLAEDPEAVAAVTSGGVGAYTPVSAVGGFLSNDTAGLSYNCGIETGWVFR